MDQAVVFAPAVLPRAAVAPLAIVDHALARAKLALGLLVRELLVELRFDDELRIVSRRRARWDGTCWDGTCPTAGGRPGKKSYRDRGRRSSTPAFRWLRSSSFPIDFLYFHTNRWLRFSKSSQLSALSCQFSVPAPFPLDFPSLIPPLPGFPPSVLPDLRGRSIVRTGWRSENAKWVRMENPTQDVLCCQYRFGFGPIFSPFFPDFSIYLLTSCIHSVQYNLVTLMVK